MERALKAVENMIGDDDPDNCITAREAPHGFWWRYTHASDEPEITLLAAIKVAGSVAADEARKRGKTYIVATTPDRSPDVYVFACDQPGRPQARPRYDV
jgi:hypothetical protein